MKDLKLYIGMIFQNKLNFLVGIIMFFLKNSIKIYFQTINKYLVFNLTSFSLEYK